ncbi:MAG TPA: NFACT RNA binding domain-containing protein [Ignavibacteria bacterium]|nr:NFACT RNA binding domain-containing protein [Ignavibacteria bacterium]
MLNNYFIIKEVASHLNECLRGLYINDIYTQEKNKLLIEVIDSMEDNPTMLEFSIEKDLNYLLVKSNYSKAKKNFAGLFEASYGKEIEQLMLFNDDRAISFVLHDEMKMIFTFFSNKANCFLTEKDIIVNAFKDKDKFLLQNINDIIPFRAETDEPADKELSVSQYIKSHFRKYGELYRKEVIFRSGLNEKVIADDNTKLVIKKCFNEVDLKLKDPIYLIYSNERSFQLSLIESEHLKDIPFKRFNNINDLISEFIKNKFRIEKTDSMKHKATSELRQKISNIEKKINGIYTQLLHSKDSESVRKTGDIILQNIYLIKKGDKIFSYISEDGIEQIIKLKEELSPSENAAYYFDKYKKQKGSVDILSARMSSFKKELIKLESELERINQMTEYKSLIKEEKKSEENKNDETSRFRKFRLNEKYEVWVGKDSASNDLLTTKYAAQNDLWFHVRGASGSHTVLKVSNRKEDAEKEFIHRAASIAAYYSKARNASNVPVAYCEKKYVKKKKGFKQGSVIMEREKVIFVKPGLPESS